jgi:beta-lactamase class A
MRDLQDAIDRSAFRDHDAQWSISVVDLDTGASLGEVDPDARLSTASIGKLLALVELAERVGTGEARLDTMVARSEADRVADSGLWQHLAIDELPLADVALLVGAVSDNLATNVLLGYLGLESVQRRAGLLGLEAVQLHDRVRDERTAGDPPRLSSGSGRELAGLMRTLRSEDGPALVLAWLRPGTDLSMVASAFGLDPLAHVLEDRGVRVINKTGTNRGVRADVGIVEGTGRGVAYAVLVNWTEPATPDDRSRDLVLDAMREIGSALRESLGQAPT